MGAPVRPVDVPFSTQPYTNCSLEPGHSKALYCHTTFLSRFLQRATTDARACARACNTHGKKGVLAPVKLYPHQPSTTLLNPRCNTRVPLPHLTTCPVLYNPTEACTTLLSNHGFSESTEVGNPHKGLGAPHPTARGQGQHLVVIAAGGPTGNCNCSCNTPSAA